MHIHQAIRLTGMAAAAILTIAGAARAADAPVTKAPPAVVGVSGPWMHLFGGFALVPDAYFGDVGAVFAVNRNLSVDGWLFRISGGAGHYEYHRTATIEQGVNFQTGDFMIGYQWLFGRGARLSTYIGANVEHHDNNDPLATIQGTKWGIKGQVELYAPITDRVFAFALVNGSSAWSSYFTLGKLGWQVSPTVAIGPEVAALGNDRFNAVRAGAWIGFNVAGTDIVLSSGHSWDTRNNPLDDHSGAYGTIHLRRSF